VNVLYKRGVAVWLRAASEVEGEKGGKFSSFLQENEREKDVVIKDNVKEKMNRNKVIRKQEKKRGNNEGGKK